MVEHQQLTVSRVRQPSQSLLAELEAHDFEAFGPTGLRIYDIAVMAQAGAIFVANLDDKMVGACQLIRLADEPSFFYVVGLYIRPEWRSRQLGRMFLLALAEETKKLSGDGLVLTVAPDNTTAVRLYESVGFAREAYVPDFYGQGEHRLIMRWRFE